MKKSITKHLFAVLIAVFMLSIVAFNADAANDKIRNVEFTVKYNQTASRSMLEMINSFRTGNEAWYWNSDNKTKTYCKNLKALSYDYDLERIAMQRAAEIALSFSHTRPNGERCFSLMSTVCTYAGENIAAGHTSASMVMEAWKETDDPYEGQGHRRNMLDGNYNAVGVACVYVNGKYYWVQEFGRTSGNSVKTEPADSNKKVTVEVDFNRADYTIAPDVATINLKCGEKKALPKLKAQLKVVNAWPGNYVEVDMISDFTLNDDTGFFKIENGYVKALGRWGAALETNVFGKMYYVEVTSEHSFKESVIKQPTCTEKGYTVHKCACGEYYEVWPLALGHYYKTTVVKATEKKDGYSEKVCANCGDTPEREVYKAASAIKLSKTKYTCNGKAMKPSVTVKTADGKSLKSGTDYTVTYASGRTLPGKYAVTVNFMGNYEGKKTLYFTILPGKTAELTATQTTNSVKLSWKKVEGATAYRIYKYNPKTGKNEIVKNTKSLTYTVTDLKAGTVYEFKVKAYAKTDSETMWAESFVGIKTATKPATPTLKATASSGKINLSWSKVSGATGYVIYMQDKSGNYQKLASTTKTSGAVSNLTKGATYSFRVRAYIKVDGKNIYGGYKTVSVKAK